VDETRMKYEKGIDNITNMDFSHYLEWLYRHSEEEKVYNRFIEKGS
jgi:hypothetical protein